MCTVLISTGRSILPTNKGSSDDDLDKNSSTAIALFGRSSIAHAHVISLASRCSFSAPFDNHMDTLNTDSHVRAHSKHQVPKVSNRIVSQNASSLNCSWCLSAFCKAGEVLIISNYRLSCGVLYVVHLTSLATVGAFILTTFYPKMIPREGINCPRRSSYQQLKCSAHSLLQTSSIFLHCCTAPGTGLHPDQKIYTISRVNVKHFSEI